MGGIEIGAAGGKGAGGVGRFALAEQERSGRAGDRFGNCGQADMGENAGGWRGWGKVNIAQQAQRNVEMRRRGM